jgi:hypothetical protein
LDGDRKRYASGLLAFVACGQNQRLYAAGDDARPMTSARSAIATSDICGRVHRARIAWRNAIMTPA